MLAQKFLYLTRVSCCLQTQLKWTVFLQRQEKCLTCCQAPSLELVKDEPQKSSEALLCLKKHLKWKIKGQTLVSLIILIWINSYWHSQAQQTRTSEPGPERLAETHPKHWSLLGLEITWTFPAPQRVRITTRTNPAEVILTLLFPVSDEPNKNTDVHENNNKQRMTAMETPRTLPSPKLLHLGPAAQDRPHLLQSTHPPLLGSLLVGCSSLLMK